MYKEPPFSHFTMNAVARPSLLARERIEREKDLEREVYNMTSYELREFYEAIKGEFGSESFEFTTKREMLSTAPRLPVDVMLKIAEWQVSSPLTNYLLHRGYLPKSVQKVLVMSEHSADRLCLAGRPRLCASVRDLLAKDSSDVVRAAIAANQATPIRLLECFVNDPSESVARGLVLNPRLPWSILRRMLTHPSKWARYDCARRPGLPEKAHVILARDACDVVRHELSLRDDLCEEAIRILAEDSSRFTRREIAANLRTPTSVRRKMVNDPCEWVIEALCKSGLDDFTSEEVSELAMNDATQPLRKCKIIKTRKDLKPEVFEKLIRDQNELVRLEVAGSGIAPVEVLIGALTDEYPPTRASAAMNPRTPIWCVDFLLYDSDEQVRSSVAFRTQDENVQEVLVADKDYQVRWGLAQNRSAGPRFLAMLHGDESPSVKTSLVFNPATPLECIAEMRLDKDRRVSECASKVYAQRTQQ